MNRAFAITLVVILIIGSVVFAISPVPEPVKLLHRPPGEDFMPMYHEPSTHAYQYPSDDSENCNAECYRVCGRSKEGCLR